MSSDDLLLLESSLLLLDDEDGGGEYLIDDFSNIPLDFIADDDARSNNVYSSITSFFDGAFSNPPTTTTDASVFINSGH
jgi:hypothetical protein